MRQIIFDTETTGLSPEKGHRITEIGCLEVIDRTITGKTFQTYLNPEREIDPAAAEITGLTTEFLADKPKFHEVVDDFLEFVLGSELVIHNAPFDIGFVNHELNLLNHKCKDLTSIATVLDTLVMARKKYPGQKNNLDALCKRLNVDNSSRNYHGALLDSEILARVYLAMTAGQTKLNLQEKSSTNSAESLGLLSKGKINLKTIKANESELAEHNSYLEFLRAKGNCVWDNLFS